jgi:hypothetical protein
MTNKIRYLQDLGTGLITRVRFDEIDLKWITNATSRLQVHEFAVNSAEHTMFLLRYSAQLESDISTLLERAIDSELTDQINWQFNPNPPQDQ